MNGAKVSMSLLLARTATSGELNQSAPENGQLASFQLVDVAAERATQAAKGFFFCFFLNEGLFITGMFHCLKRFKGNQQYFDWQFISNL